MLYNLQLQQFLEMPRQACDWKYSNFCFPQVPCQNLELPQYWMKPRHTQDWKYLHPISLVSLLAKIYSSNNSIPRNNSFQNSSTEDKLISPQIFPYLNCDICKGEFFTTIAILLHHCWSKSQPKHWYVHWRLHHQQRAFLGIKRDKLTHSEWNGVVVSLGNGNFVLLLCKLPLKKLLLSSYEQSCSFQSCLFQQLPLK